jgi:hypothetical protein
MLDTRTQPATRRLRTAEPEPGWMLPLDAADDRRLGCSSPMARSPARPSNVRYAVVVRDRTDVP